MENIYISQTLSDCVDFKILKDMEQEECIQIYDRETQGTVRNTCTKDLDFVVVETIGEKVDLASIDQYYNGNVKGFEILRKKTKQTKTNNNNKNTTF